MGYDVPSMLSTAASLLCFGAACPFIGDAVSTPPSFLVSSITRQGGFLAEGGPRRPRVTSRTPGGFFPTREGEVLGVIAKGLPPGSIDASACAVDAGAKPTTGGAPLSLPSPRHVALQQFERTPARLGIASIICTV